jgi:transcriptional regulator with GAF, ATPase, and Fis domain
VELESLPPVILAIAEQRSLPAVLTTIINAVARQPGVALARLWLRESDEDCPVCCSGELNPEQALHLRASAGTSVAPHADWTRINGGFHRIPLSPGNLKIAHIGTTGESIRISDLATDGRWVRDPAWAESEGLASFTGHALMFRGQPLGVLAVFRRIPADDDCYNWLRTMASAAAVAIANARAFEENEALRRELELERDYLREEVQDSGSFGEIPLDLQSKLLRVLQEGEFERVGDESTRRVNVRVVAATNRDLRKEVEHGRFRLDLYYRLGVFPMEVPPLRDRKEDVPSLIAHFLRQAALRFHVAAPNVPAREMERAQRYDWPGNVRELQNVVERAVIVSRGAKLSFDLPEVKTPGGRPLRPAPPSPGSDETVIPEHEWRNRERANVTAALRQANSRISGKGGAADLLGISPSTLASRIKSLGIERGSYERDDSRFAN